MKSLYESLVDWKLKTDYLQCNPNFHGNIPYDCIIISSSEQNFSAHLLMVFTYKCHHATFLFTLVQPFTDVRYQCKKRHRFQASSTSAHSIFIPVRSICRGALLVLAFDAKNEYIVVDVLNTEMFLCIREMYP